MSDVRRQTSGGQSPKHRVRNCALSMLALTALLVFLFTPGIGPPPSWSGEEEDDEQRTDSDVDGP